MRSHNSTATESTLGAQTRKWVPPGATSAPTASFRQKSGRALSKDGRTPRAFFSEAESRTFITNPHHSSAEMAFMQVEQNTKLQTPNTRKASNTKHQTKPQSAGL